MDQRGVFANRTLNLRSIKAIGYDLDYTLVHYNTDQWEGRAYHHARRRLVERGWPLDGLEFESSRVTQGLTIDLELGNLVKATRFGYVIRAMHGTRLLEFDEMRRAYAGTFVDLSEDRWVFLNTLFSLSEATLFGQLVDLADSGQITPGVGYEGLYRAARASLDAAHMEGTLKAEILEDPERFIEFDTEVIATLLDQRRAGKQLMLITNSDWEYADRIMKMVFDPVLGGSWRRLFDAVIVSADKPAFFSGEHRLYKVVDEDFALLRPHHGSIDTGAVYFGGCARLIEDSLGLSGDEILYVGDHLFGDVHASKSMLRWRTALILRELEAELDALERFAPTERRLTSLMGDKETLEAALSSLRLERQRAKESPGRSNSSIDRDIEATRDALAKLDAEIAPLAMEAGVLANPNWGLLMRSGVDKSLFARQVERYADVYTSRVANFLHATPHAFLRAARTSLPHDID